MKSRALIIFLKYPENGKVKTRLAKDFDESFATEFYKLCVEKLIIDIKTHLIIKIDIYIFCSSREEIEPVKKWLGNEFIYKFQNGHNLGKKMQNAFEEVFKSEYKQAVIIGTDIPELNSEIIFESFEQLDKYDSVIGPSSDGGYYLLGIKQIHPELFREINWSTHQVLNETLQKINNLKISYYLMGKLTDIDTANDLHEWMKNINGTPDESLIKFTKEYLAGG